MLSGAKLPKPLNGASDHMGRATIKSQRPTALLTCRNRSESPITRSKSRPSDICFSSPSDQKLDLDALERELELKSGVLNFGSETFVAQMADFINELLLGSGTCSSVYRMRHRTKPELIMAVKHMRRSSTCQEENKRILMDLSVVSKSNDCPFIVDCFGIFFTTSDVWICMEVMATCLDKLLRDLERPFPERVIGKVTVSIITALDYLKQMHNIMHRDVKPSNMLLSFNGVIKLCDFGISGKLKDSIARSRQLGCIGYMAPERLETPTYDVRADIWSLGISLVELATGTFPYKGTEIEFAIMSKIISDPAPTLPHHIPFTPGFRHFTELCLQKDHRRRPKYKSLMNTEFFSRHNVVPFDVLDWVKGLPLKHLHRSGDNLANAASPATSSPNSNKTLSPELGHNLHDLSLDNSVVMEDPRVIPRDVILRRNGSNVALSDTTSVIRPTGDDSVGCRHQPDHVPEPMTLCPPVGPTMKLAQFRDTPSLASSGYGSVGSDDSPNSWCSNNRPPSSQTIGVRVMLDPSKWGSPHSKLHAGQSDLGASKKTEQWITTSSSSLITKHTPVAISNNIHSIPASPRNSPKVFHTLNESTTTPVPKLPGFSSRVGYFETIGCPPRSFTPPVDKSAKPVSSATDSSVNPNKAAQLRSSSVGPQLHRSAAQRWLCKPELGDNSPHYLQPFANLQLVTRLPTVFDHRRSDSKTDPDPSTRFSPAPPPVPPHRSRPSQKSLQSHQPTTIRHPIVGEDSSAEVQSLQTQYLTGLRLSHRLHTHPIPRQINHINSLRSCAANQGKVNNLLRNAVPNLPECRVEGSADRLDEKPRLKPPKPLRPSSRSASHPALPRIPNNWRSFETDL